MRNGSKSLFYLMVSKISIQNPWLHGVCAHSGTDVMVMGPLAHAGQETEVLMTRLSVKT